MSINVTVTGNPISIQKGRMVTASPSTSKREFERRRLIRLSQVRQQSKNIAEDVRNRVRQQKLKQVEEIEKEGKRKLKQWQARKLLELQNQYHEALRDIGAGHREANTLEAEAEVLLEKRENDTKTAKHRALIASKKFREEKERLKHNVSVPIQKKKLVREIEDRRAHMITGLKRSSESFKKKNDEKLLTETDVSGIVTESDSEFEDIEEVSNTANIQINFDESPRESIPLRVIKEVSERNPASDSAEDNSVKSSVSDQDEKLLKELREQKDTRLSDRIRKRSAHQLDQPDVCDTLSQPCRSNQTDKNTSKNLCAPKSGSKTMFPSVQQNIYACSCSRKPAVVPSPVPCHCTHPTPRMQEPGLSDINKFRCKDFTDEEDNLKASYRTQKIPTKTSNSKSGITAAPPSSPKRPTMSQSRMRQAKEIPTKPKVTLKSVKSPTTQPGIFSEKTVQQLQSKTRRSRFPESHVERISQDNLITSPGVVTEVDFYEKIRQRDKEALLRGQKALEREKLQREYNELLKKLPALQKLERLYEMNQDKPEYHMTEDRLREQEKKKQNILDNTYEKLFPDKRPPTITIPIKNTSKETMKEKEKVSKSEDSATLNLGAWETEKRSKRLYTEEEVEAMLREGKVPSESRFRTDQLKSVLEKLRKQKEELLKEIQNLPVDGGELSKGPTSLKQIGTKKVFSTTTDSSADNKKSQKTTKKFVSVKIGTNSTLHSSSSNETVEEPVKKQPKPTKQVKLASKATQVSHPSHKSKPVVKTKTSTKESAKPGSPQKVAKKRRQEKEIVSSSEQSSNEQKTEKKTSSKESSKSTQGQQMTKRQKQVETCTVDHSITPSAPANSMISVDEQKKKSKSENSQPSRVISCDCKKDPLPKKTSELCEIVIKIKDGKSSEILIKDNKETGKENMKSVIVEKPVTKKPRKIEENKVPIERQHELLKSMQDDCCQSKDTKPHSWHEKFSRNNSQVSNSSTSYLSPPQLPNKSENESRAPPYFGQLMGKKPQQVNLDEMLASPPTRLPVENRNVLQEINRLLNMSRLSIDELGVSSVSTVTTPSQSIIDLESNKGDTSTTRNTSTSHFSVSTKTNQQLNISSDSHSQNGLPNFSFLTVSSDNKTIIASEIDSNNTEQYPEVLAKYAKIADKCSQRISNLSAMIEKVREEKKRMLQTSTLVSNNDSSTRYMDLPSPKKSTNEKDSIDEGKSASSSSSGEGRSIIEIDYSLAEKLKGLTPEEIENFGKTQGNRDVNDSRAEEDLAKRLKALKEPPVLNDNQVTEKDKSEKELAPKVVSGSGDSIEFTPFLLNIPKLPPLSTDTSNSKHRKPPPSKGFLAARKLTEDYAVPHELSTIPEQDSQMRLESTFKDKSPQTPKTSKSSSTKETVLDNKRTPTSENKQAEKKSIENPVSTQPKGEEAAPLGFKTKPQTPSNKNRTPKVKEIFNISDNSLGSSNTSGDEKIEMFQIEAMLRSIGMDWAISTLRKTQEALALTSSSSSIDLKTSATIKELSESEIKEYLTKQMFQKISSSTLRSDASPGSLNESHELSGIHNDFSKKQTSTPVNRSVELNRSHEKSSDLPSAIESEKGSKQFFSLSGNSP